MLNYIFSHWELHLKEWKYRAYSRCLATTLRSSKRLVDELFWLIDKIFQFGAFVLKIPWICFQTQLVAPNTQPPTLYTFESMAGSVGSEACSFWETPLWRHPTLLHKQRGTDLCEGLSRARLVLPLLRSPVFMLPAQLTASSSVLGCTEIKAVRWAVTPSSIVPSPQ